MKKNKKKVNIGILFITSLIVLSFMKFLNNKNDENITKKIKSYNTDTLILINSDNKIPDNYEPILTEYKDFKIDNSMLEDLKEMEESACNDNTCLYINSAYRNSKDQEKEFNKKVDEYLKNGNSKEQAIKLVQKEVNKPNYSEHELGLALDFSMTNNDYNWKMWYWLQDNSYKYGFILRYPKNKEEITKIKYEPWHYRYVGKDNAKIIHEKNLCLEEYIDIIN